MISERLVLSKQEEKNTNPNFTYTFFFFFFLSHPRSNLYKALCIQIKFEPVHEIMVVISQTTSECSGEPAQSRQSLRCSHTWSMEVDEGSNQSSDIYPHWMATHAHLKNDFTEDHKYHNLMTWLIVENVRKIVLLSTTGYFFHEFDITDLFVRRVGFVVTFKLIANIVMNWIKVKCFFWFSVMASVWRLSIKMLYSYHKRTDTQENVCFSGQCICFINDCSLWLGQL